MNCKSSLSCQAADFRGFCFLIWNIHELDIASPKSPTSHARMSRWRLVTLVSVLLGGTGLMSNCRSAVKGSPKLQPPYLSKNQREIHCCPHPKALIPLDEPCQHVTAPPGNSSLTSQSLFQCGAKPPLPWEPFFGGKNPRSLATLSQNCWKPPFEEDPGAQWTPELCLPLRGEMLLLTVEMSSSVYQWQMDTSPASLSGRWPLPQALMCSCLAEPRPTPQHKEMLRLCSHCNGCTPPSEAHTETLQRVKSGGKSLPRVYFMTGCVRFSSF